MSVLKTFKQFTKAGAKARVRSSRIHNAFRWQAFLATGLMPSLMICLELGLAESFFYERVVRRSCEYGPSVSIFVVVVASPHLSFLICTQRKHGLKGPSLHVTSSRGNILYCTGKISVTLVHHFVACALRLTSR